MSWYKQASFNPYESVLEEQSSIMAEYYRPSRKKGQHMSWSVVPFARLKKIWEDYSKFGFIRDENGINNIADQIFHILARLQAATDLAGHGGSVDFKEDIGCKEPNPKNTDFYFSFLETEYGTPISDYGLRKLWSIVEKLMSAKSPEEKLLLIDQMLNVIHQRGDLAALFIEGGSASLSQLSS